MMFFHIISGPISLILDIITICIYKSIGIGGIMKLFKIYTVTRNTIMGAIIIFPVLLPAFLGLVSIICVISMWALSNLRDV
jgi:hypothetical protein